MRDKICDSLYHFVKLLEDLISIHAPSGEEFRMKNFLLDYVRKNLVNWKVAPQIIEGDGLQDNLILIFGEPRTAIFAHMDSVGFTARYENQLVPIGGPEVEDGQVITGRDGMGLIECRLKVDEDYRLTHDFQRPIERGTSLIFKPNLIIKEELIEGTFLDNRLGILNALKVAESLENGAVVFSTFEEHGGGSVPLLVKYLYEYHHIKQALISDITWVTDGVKHGEGVVISLRDKNIPRKKFIDKILEYAETSGVPYQLEVEGGGSSDGREVHHAPYPVDWCFIGAPENNVHSPKETVHIRDFQAMNDLYIYLMKNL